MKVLTVVGARPQFIKAAPLHAALLAGGHEHVLIHTGQHYDPELSRRFFEELDLPEPDADLGVGSADRATQLAAIQQGLAPVLEAEAPDRVLVVGDTNSTLGGARAAAAAHLPLAHVEAGLRSGDPMMPEERNRIETDRLADLLLCPTESAARTLTAEDVGGAAHVVGDVMVDALERFRPRLSERTAVALGLEPGAYLLVTLHRQENMTAERVAEVLAGVGDTGIPAVLPAHPRLSPFLGAAALPPALRVVEPIGYLDNLSLQAYARAVLTDSGGMQKEAYWLGVPCVTLRNTTEWIETVDAGWNRLATDRAAIAAATLDASSPAERPALYGPPGAAERIVALL